MNTLLIENLSDQADVDTRQIASRVSHLSPWKKRFAELIVQECFRIVDDYAVEQASDPENYLGESLKVSMKITDAAWKIKEHFGIKS